MGDFHCGVSRKGPQQDTSTGTKRLSDMIIFERFKEGGPSRRRDQSSLICLGVIKKSEKKTREILDEDALFDIVLRTNKSETTH
jgi:hypothetical protein